MYRLLLTLLLVYSPAALAEKTSQSVPSGAFTTLMVQAQDPAAYIETLKANSSIFEELGSSVAGACVTRSGNEYSGQMFIWNAYDTISAAMASSATYDAYNASPEVAAAREVKYGATFKPLKEFKLDPAFERLWRVKVAAENLDAFVGSVTELEKQIRDDGYDWNAGVFMPIGGGSEEVGYLHFRAVGRSAESLGAIIDAYFDGASWAQVFDSAMSFVIDIKTDTFEECEVIYRAN